jgi:type II secretory pathway pseudopilin PulG
MMELLVVLLVIGGIVLVMRTVTRNNQRRELEERTASDLAQVRKVSDEDVTRFGEELQRLDSELLTERLDEATRQDYQRALDSYESAKESLRLASKPEDVRHVT